MQELLALVLEYLRGIWRFRWVALGVAWAVAIAGWLWVAQLPEKYVATARVNIDTNTVLRPLLRGIAIQPDVGQRVRLLSKTLLSRPNLEKLMRMTDLDLQAKTEQQKERLLKMLSEEIRLSGDRRNPSLYTVSFRHYDRDTAKRVVQAVLTVFIESTLGEKRTETEGAQEFLDTQIKEYEKRLEQAEARLADFKRRHAGRLSADVDTYYSKLEQAKSQLAKAQLALREAQNRRKQLQQQLEDEEPEMAMDPMMGGEMSPLDARIEALRAKLDELLIRYTERHPEVRQIKGLIAELEKQREEELAQAGDEGEVGAGLQANPIYQQLKNMLTATDAEIASLRVRVGEYKKRVEDLAKIIDNIPKIEAEQKQLNRDYQVIYQQYQTLVKRRETARLGEKVSQTADDVKFRVVDPPFVPLQPTEPNKVLLNAAVLLVAIAVGAGVALLLSLLKPVFSDRRRLSLSTGLPVLGSITLVTSAEERRKAMLATLAFVALSVALLLVFAALNMESITGWGIGTKLKELGRELL